MQVKELIRQLQAFEPEQMVYMAQDPELNNIRETWMVQDVYNDSPDNGNCVLVPSYHVVELNDRLVTPEAPIDLTLRSADLDEPRTNSYNKDIIKGGENG